MGEAGMVADAVGGLNDRLRVAMHPHPSLGGEGPVTA